MGVLIGNKVCHDVLSILILYEVTIYFYSRHSYASFMEIFIVAVKEIDAYSSFNMCMDSY